MKAMVLHDWVKDWGGNLKLEEREKPKAGRGEVVIKVSACGVGSTVSNFLRGDMLPDKKFLPRVPGHEVTGVIDEAGPDVKALAVGDRVLLYFYLACDRCAFCLAGRQDHCENSGGFIGQHIDGGYAEFVKVPAGNVFKLPGRVKPVDGTVICDAVATPCHVANDRAQIRPQEYILVFGAGGGVGIHMIQVAKAFGACTIGVDIGKAKLDAAKSVGADLVVDASTPEWAEDARKFTDGRGIDVVVDFVGSEKTMDSGVNLLTTRGRFVQMTTRMGMAMRAENRKLVRYEIALMGSRYCTKREFREAAELVEAGKVKPVISTVKALEHVEELHKLLAQNALVGRAAITMD